MAISGIVINLESDLERREVALRHLSAMPQLDLGPRNGLRLPAVMDTGSVKAARACWDEIMALSGVAGIDLVYIHYENETSLPESGTVEEADT